MEAYVNVVGHCGSNGPMQMTYYSIQPVPGNRGQTVITFHPHNDEQNPRRFRTTQILSSYGAESLRGRGTRVFEAVEIDGNGDPNGSPVVLKDTWVDSDRTREGNIIASLHSAANDEDRQLVEEAFPYHDLSWRRLDRARYSRRYRKCSHAWIEHHPRSRLAI
jgi:hypothetical protein